MEANGLGKGYWAGMTTGLRARFLVWSAYWLLTVWLATLHPFFCIALIGLPILLWIAKVWVLEEVLGLGGSGESGGLMVYTIGYLWKSSVYIRAILGVTLLAAALGSLGWLGTQEMRAEVAQPTLIEKAHDMANSTADIVGDAASATKETTKGWIATAKGWFGTEDTAPE